MKGVVQLGNGILDDALGLCDGALQQSKLLLQKLLLKLLLQIRLHVHAHTTTYLKDHGYPSGLYGRKCVIS